MKPFTEFPFEMHNVEHITGGGGGGVSVALEKEFTVLGSRVTNMGII